MQCAECGEMLQHQDKDCTDVRNDWELRFKFSRSLQNALTWDNRLLFGYCNIDDRHCNNRKPSQVNN